MHLAGAMKVVKPAPGVEAFMQLGVPVSLSVEIGTVLLICTALYAIPRTGVLGALLLTAYLGCAVVANLRAGEPLFSHTLFPVYFGVLLWAGLILRDGRLLPVILGPR